MKQKLIVWLVIISILVLIVGCGPKKTPEFEFKFQDENITEEEFVKEGREAAEPTPEPVPEPEPAKPKIPTKATWGFSAESRQTVVSVDPDTADVVIKVEGELSYEIAEDGSVTGEGKEDLTIEIESDIGIAVCKVKKTISGTFKLEGKYDEEKDRMAIGTFDLSPKTITLNLKCPTDAGVDIKYDLTVPLMVFTDSGDVFFTGEKHEFTKKIKHNIPDWDTDLEVEYTFKLKSEEFSFDVDVDPAIVTIKQGDTATVNVHVSGSGTDVTLTHTQWAPLNSHIANTVVTPVEDTTLTVETDCDTPPDQYLITVTGSTDKSFYSSADAVNIIVEKNPSC